MDSITSQNQRPITAGTMALTCNEVLSGGRKGVCESES